MLVEDNCVEVLPGFLVDSVSNNVVADPASLCWGLPEHRTIIPPVSNVRLGPLEQRVMEALWQRSHEARVRDLQPDFADVAYTTLMTTLERLHRKGMLDRVPSGRAFAYRPRLSRGQLQAADALGALRSLVSGGGSIEPVLSHLVEEGAMQDREALAALERLIRNRRRALEDQEG